MAHLRKLRAGRRTKVALQVRSSLLALRGSVSASLKVPRSTVEVVMGSLGWKVRTQVGTKTGRSNLFGEFWSPPKVSPSHLRFTPRGEVTPTPYDWMTAPLGTIFCSLSAVLCAARAADPCGFMLAVFLIYFSLPLSVAAASLLASLYKLQVLSASIRCPSLLALHLCWCNALALVHMSHIGGPSGVTSACSCVMACVPRGPCHRLVFRGPFWWRPRAHHDSPCTCH